MQQNQPQKPLLPVSSAPVPVTTSGGNTAKYAGMVVVGVIAGVLIAWGWSSWRPSPASTTNGTATTTSSTTSTSTGGTTAVDTSTASLSSASLSITSPQPAGDSVAVASAIVSAPTWVVIYEDNNGKPGNALGAALFFPGSPSGTVELLRATTAGKTYLAVKQVDNGDRKFSLKTDQLLAEGGQVQWVTFETK